MIINNSYNNSNLILLIKITNNNGLALLVLIVMGFMQFKYMFRKSWKDLLDTIKMKKNKELKKKKNIIFLLHFSEILQLSVQTTEIYCILSHALKNTANQRLILPLPMLRCATGNIPLYFSVITCAQLLCMLG